MSDFELPLNPGWYAALEEKHGDIIDAAAAVSPAVIHRYEQLAMGVEVPAKPVLRVAETKATYNVEPKRETP